MTVAAGGNAVEDKDLTEFEEIQTAPDGEQDDNQEADNKEENKQSPDEKKKNTKKKKIKKPRPQRKKRRRWAFPLGLLMLLLCVVGIVSILSSLAGFIKEKTDNSEELAYYNEYLTWVVANDPDSFDDISKANPTQLLDISILSLLYDDLSTDEYELTDEGIAVPAADVEKYYEELFGTEKPIEHGSVSGIGYTFTYDSENNMYYVPITGVTPPFTPKVVSVDSSRGAVVIKVGYIGTSKLTVGADGSITGAEPDKYMNITLRKTGGRFCIYSIQSANPPETGS